MNSTEIETIESESEVDSMKTERAVSEMIQSKCSLIAVCLTLLSLPAKRNKDGENLSKKVIKKIRKMIQKEVNAEVGKRIANEIISGNLASLKGAADGIRYSKVIPKGKHHLLLEDMSERLMTSMLIGYNNFYGK